MEKHKCKLCYRSFSNGRALGGHMRGHMMNLPLPTKPEEYSSISRRTIQLSFEADHSASSSSSSSDDDDEDDGKGVCYGLRENPKRSIRVEDPEFSFVNAAETTGSVVSLQDRESETESSKNPTLRRSKRALKFGVFNNKKQVHEREAMMNKKIKFCKSSTNKIESWVVDHEPLSSVSDATTEEDVAFCLMMLSRDKDNKWKTQNNQQQFINDRDFEEQEEEQEDEDEDDDEGDRSLEDSDASEELRLWKNRVRGRYKCETCNKVFRSYQALGGHRASHKKIKLKKTKDEEQELENENNGRGTSNPMVVEKKIHECPVCFRVFASGQALGGHKRTHVIGLTTTTQVPSSTKLGNNNYIDLNLPAPIDDDDISQIEISAVSDAEFVKPH